MPPVGQYLHLDSVVFFSLCHMNTFYLNKTLKWPKTWAHVNLCHKYLILGVICCLLQSCEENWIQTVRTQKYKNILYIVQPHKNELIKFMATLFIFTVSGFYPSPGWKIFCINPAMMDGNFIGNIALILLPVKNVFKLMSVPPVKIVILFASNNKN